MSTDKLEFVQSNLDLIQDGITTLNTLMKPEDDNPEQQSMLIASKVLIESFDGCLARMGSTYKKYHQEIVDSGTKMVNALNHDYQTVLNNIKNIEDELNKYKDDYDVISKPIDEYLKRNHKEPRLCFQSDIDHSYEFDVELMKKYPDSYFWYLYKNPHLWTDTGDINIDCSGDNYDSILQYMKNDNDDDSLVQNLKRMDVKKRKEFVNDLDFLRLPLLKRFINELCFDDDKMKMEAWKNRIIMVNGNQAESINMYLKKKRLFDTIFNNNSIQNINYNKNTNIIYVNIGLKHFDWIENYCKNYELDKNMKVIDGNDHNIDIFKKEIQKLRIPISNREMKIMMKCLDDHLFTKISSIIKEEDYDYKLQEWLGYQYRWKLIYKASEHKYTSKSFHDFCDDQGPTLILIKTSEGFIFGAYTSKSWKNEQTSQYGDLYKFDSDSFMFTLKNPNNILPTKCINIDKANSQIICSNNCGPFFYNTANVDLSIGNNCDQLKSCYIHNSDIDSHEHNSQYNTPLFVNKTGPDNKDYFSISEYEVYAIDNSL